MKTPFESKKFRVTQIQHSDHQAMDLVCDENYNIVAVEDGEVTSSQMVTDKSNLTWTYGNYIKYRLKDGTYILVAHLSKRLVKKGDKVKKGQVIGVMGNTGYSFGAHLHIEHRASDGNTRLKVYEYLGIENEKGAVKEVETKPDPVPTPSVGVKEGDLVALSAKATYYNGADMPSWVKSQKWYVLQVDGDYVVIDENEAKTKHIESAVNAKYLVVVKSKPTVTPTTKPKLRVGAKVELVNGAVYTNGVKVPPQYIGEPFTVQQLLDGRVLIAELYSWVATKYVKVVG